MFAWCLRVLEDSEKQGHVFFSLCPEWGVVQVYNFCFRGCTATSRVANFKFATPAVWEECGTSFLFGRAMPIFSRFVNSTTICLGRYNLFEARWCAILVSNLYHSLPIKPKIYYSGWSIHAFSRKAGTISHMLLCRIPGQNRQTCQTVALRCVRDFLIGTLQGLPLHLGPCILEMREWKKCYIRIIRTLLKVNPSFRLVDSSWAM